MKKNGLRFLSVVSLLLILPVASCQRDNVVLPDDGQAVYATFTFRTEVVSESSDTKTTFAPLFGGYYQALWGEKDVAGVTVDYDTDYVPVTITPSANHKSGTFSATLAAPGSGTFCVQAVVPATKITCYNKASDDITINIPASQTPTATGPDPAAMILAANLEMDAVPAADQAILLPFYHTTAYGCLSLTNLPTDATIRAIDLVFDVPVCGKWRYNPGSKSIIEELPANIITIHTSTAENVFFACAPANLKNTHLKVRLITEQGVYEHSMTVNSDASFRSGQLVKFSIDMGESTKKTSISVLALGHSFAEDTYWNLYTPLAQMGYTDIKLGIMFKGNCSLREHVTYYRRGGGHSRYEENITGSWDTYEKPVLANVLDAREWDYITIQQCVDGQGQAASYDPWLDEIIDIVRSHRPKAKLFWNMLWAFDNDYRNPQRFAPYSFNQLTMYDDIIGTTTRTTVVPTGAFGDVVPCGTAVQNLRTTSLVSEITRDGYHMSYRVGRFVTALMMCRLFCSETIAGVTFSPSEYSYTDEEISFMKEAVESAYVAPFRITPHGTLPNPDPDPNSIGAGFEDSVTWDKN